MLGRVLKIEKDSFLTNVRVQLFEPHRSFKTLNCVTFIPIPSINEYHINDNRLVFDFEIEDVLKKNGDLNYFKITKITEVPIN